LQLTGNIEIDGLPTAQKVYTIVAASNAAFVKFASDLTPGQEILASIKDYYRVSSAVLAVEKYQIGEMSNLSRASLSLNIIKEDSDRFRLFRNHLEITKKMLSEFDVERSESPLNQITHALNTTYSILRILSGRNSEGSIAAAVDGLTSLKMGIWNDDFSRDDNFESCCFDLVKLCCDFLKLSENSWESGGSAPWKCICGEISSLVLGILVTDLYIFRPVGERSGVEELLNLCCTHMPASFSLCVLLLSGRVSDTAFVYGVLRSDSESAVSPPPAVMLLAVSFGLSLDQIMTNSDLYKWVVDTSVLMWTGR